MKTCGVVQKNVYVSWVACMHLRDSVYTKKCSPIIIISDGIGQQLRTTTLPLMVVGWTHHNHPIIGMYIVDNVGHLDFILIFCLIPNCSSEDNDNMPHSPLEKDGIVTVILSEYT